MKTLKTILAAFAIAFGAMTASAQSMSYEAMRNNARFLTDRMAYELGIRSMSVIDDIYRINFDYIYGVNEYLDEVALGYFYDDYMELCARRDYALRRLLGDIVWNRLLGYSYFHRPIIFSNYRWHFGIYDYDRYGVHHYFYREPRHFHREYRGGHFFHGMAPSGGHIHRPTPQPHRDGARGGMNRPQGGNDRPQGGMNNRPQGGNDRPQGGMNRPQGGNDRPQGGANNGGMNRPQGGNDRPQGGINNGSMNRPQGGMSDRPNGANSGGISRSQGGSVSRGSSTGRSDNNMRSSSRSSGGSSYTPSRSGATRGGNAGGGSRGGSYSGGGSRGGRR